MVCVCLSVCLSGTPAGPAKTDEPMEIIYAVGKQTHAWRPNETCYRWRCPANAIERLGPITRRYGLVSNYYDHLTAFVHFYVPAAESIGRIARITRECGLLLQT